MVMNGFMLVGTIILFMGEQSGFYLSMYLDIKKPGFLQVNKTRTLSIVQINNLKLNQALYS